MIWVSPVYSADTIRVATLHTGLKRSGPGLLLRDILTGEDPQVLMVRDMIVAVQPDVILLTRFDFDHGLVALNGFAGMLSESGLHFPHLFALAPNSGVATGEDMDGDGWLGDARDAHGFGDFSGHGGMAILSRFPIDAANVQNLTGIPWRRVFDNAVSVAFPDQPLSSVGHWDVPVIIPEWRTPLRLLAYHAGTPAFDGLAGRNSRRNAAENLMWIAYLDGELGMSPPQTRFVILGDSNLDPKDGEGQRQAIRQVLSDRRLQDPAPRSRGAVKASEVQGGPNIGHTSDPAFDTADFRDSGGPGNLRVDYVLPSRDLNVQSSGVFWPAKDELGAEIVGNRDPKMSWHGLVWADIFR